MELWSDLPQGSGLGTSRYRYARPWYLALPSILAGAVIAAIWTVLGAEYTRLEVASFDLIPL